MSEFLASIGPVGWIAASMGGLVGYFGICVGIGRFCGSNDRGDEHVNLITKPLPPVPPAADEFDRFLRLINEDAA